MQNNSGTNEVDVGKSLEYMHIMKGEMIDSQEIILMTYFQHRYFCVDEYLMNLLFIIYFCENMQDSKIK